MAARFAPADPDEDDAGEPEVTTHVEPDDDPTEGGKEDWGFLTFDDLMKD